MEQHTLPPYLASNPNFIGKNWVYVNQINGRTMVAPDALALFLQMLGEMGNNGHYHSLYVHKTAHSLKSTFGNSFINTLSHTNQSAFYINPTSNLMMADIYGRQVGIVKADKGSHITKPLSARQALLGGNILGSVWMRVSQTNGNWADKGGAAFDESVNSLKGVAVYGSISLSAVAAASGKMAAVGAIAVPSLSMGGALGYALLALGYMGWGMSLLGVFANVGYRRYDQNTKQNPFASILGKQLT